MPSTKDMRLFGVLTLELTSYCNRSCPMCARAAGLDGRFDAKGKPTREVMSVENASRILDQCRDMGFCGRVGFTFYSEALSCAETLFTVAEHAKSLGMQPYLVSNTDYLKDSMLPRIRDTFVGVQVSLYDADRKDRAKHETHWRKATSLPTRVVYASQMYSLAVHAKERQPLHKKCIGCAKRLIVLWDGRSAFCCEDANAQFPLKNVLTTSVNDSWYDPNRWRILAELAKGNRTVHPFCAKCYRSNVC